MLLMHKDLRQKNIFSGIGKWRKLNGDERTRMDANIQEMTKHQVPMTKEA